MGTDTDKRRPTIRPMGCNPWAFVVCLLLLTTPARACNVPVFRYALEHWDPDVYEVIVFHKEALKPADQAVVEALQKYADTGSSNFTLQAVDLSKQPDAAMLKLFQAQTAPQLPWMVVRFPAGSRIEQSLWAGRLDADTLKALFDSPVRRELAKRILKGESAVWVLLESGKREKDVAAAKLLEDQLKTIEKTVRLPQRTSAPADRLRNEEGLPLRLTFSVVRVGRDDPAEAALVQMLLKSESDLAQRSDPMVFPVFGRGRLLYGLIGAGITAANIEETCTYLVGVCSCEVKRQNPGVDLLLAVDWEAPFEGRQLSDPPPPLVGLSEFAPPPPETAPSPVVEAEADPPASPNSALFRNVAVALALALAVVVLATFILRARLRP